MQINNHSQEAGMNSLKRYGAAALVTVASSGIGKSGTDKLTYFCPKSGYSERINQTIDSQSGALSGISVQSNSLCVAPTHGLELTCQYHKKAQAELSTQAFIL